MIKSKEKLIYSIVILGICMCLYSPFPNNLMVNTTSSFMSFPITNYDGYVSLGIFGSVLFIIAMILLVKSIKKYRLLTVVLVLMVYTFLPHYLITIYQETLASGIMAISYTEYGECKFDMVGKDLLNGECHLELQNRSNEAVSFELEFLDDHFLEDGMRMVSLMNIAGPYHMTIEANRKKSFHIKELLDLSEIPKHIEGGSSRYIHIKIRDGETARIL